MKQCFRLEKASRWILPSLRVAQVASLLLGHVFARGEMVSEDLGEPAKPGGTLVVTNGYVLTTTGAQIGGATDQGRFLFETRTGDFDVQVRIIALDAGDLWAKAGLMARESLAADSRAAAAVATPTLCGCFFQSRKDPGAMTAATGSFPVNYPLTWLRMRRAGTVFTGYASCNGEDWRVLGSVELALSNTVQVGLVAGGGADNAPVKARFEELRDARNPGEARRLPREPLGPSSRKTGLAITEIMYHPPQRTDGRQLEFIELFNANPFYEDLSGYRISGEVNYVFPEGTLIPGGGFLVVARSVDDLKAVYGLASVYGSFTGALKSSGTIRLLNRIGSVLLEVAYEDSHPWPVAADGTGHSLVLARPSFGEANPSAWSHSGNKGGSPGGVDGLPDAPLDHVVINEVLANSDSPEEDFVELYNPSAAPIDISGCFLSDDPTVNKFRIPDGTVLGPRGFAVFRESSLGFGLNATGERLYWVNPDGTRVLKALSIGAQGPGVTVGCDPDGAPELYPLSAPTPGSANALRQSSDIVIHEIMYHPISEQEDDEYLELHNRGSSAADLGGWRFTSGIDYEFPAGTILPAGGYLVVAKNAGHLRQNYAHLNAANCVGDFAGKLSNSGERLALARPEQNVDANSGLTERGFVEVTEVTYGTGGRWGRWSDGGGSSLELIDARSNARLAANWADSDETRKAGWTSVEATGVLDLGVGSMDSVQILLLEAGECLVDNVEILSQGTGTNLLANPGFESGIAPWVTRGDHVRSSLETTEGFDSTQSLHVRASNQGDTGVNCIRSPITRSSLLVPGETATLRARVRWLCGFPEIVVRLKGNYLEATGRMLIPANLGTPGLPNSRAVANAGPAVYAVNHQPALPESGQDTLVTARVQDSDGVAGLDLVYRLDPGANWIHAPMLDDGTLGDEAAGDGCYSARIPGQAGGVTVAFYLEARDGSSDGTHARFPDDAPARECLVRFGEAKPVSSFGTYRLWLSTATVNAWKSRPVLSNEDLDGTFVYGNERVVYNMGARLTGSPWHQTLYNSPTGPACSYALRFPEDNQLLGTSSFNKLHAPGNSPGDDPSIQREQVAYWMARQLDLPWNYQRYVVTYVNGVRRGSLMEDTQVPNADGVREHFPEDPDGDLYKINGWYEFDSSLANTPGFQLASWCTLNNYTTTGGAKKLARYRWNFAPRAMNGTANNYASLFGLIDAAQTPLSGPYVENMSAVADMPQWLRTFALEHAVGNWDSFGNRNAQNMFAYKPTQGPWKLLIWDFNIVLGNSGSDGPSGDDLFQFNYADRAMAKIYSHPQYARAYLRNLQEIAAGPMALEQAEPILDARYAAFKANGLSVGSPASIKTWIRSRQTYLQRYLTNFAATFAVTNIAGPTLVTNQNWITLEGTAPIEVDTMKFNGTPYPVVWTSLLSWQAKVPLPEPTNVLAIEGFTAQDILLRSAVAALTLINTAPMESPAGALVLNEILASPSEAGAEFVEIHNASTRSVFDLTGCRLEGTDFDFPPGTLIGPKEFLVVVKNRAIFTAVYGNGVKIIGEFAGNLKTEGETLRLVRRGPVPQLDEVLDEVTFASTPPWPQAARLPGASLQLKNPPQDNNRSANWYAIDPESLRVPVWKQVRVTGQASGSKLLVYHSPRQAASDPLDITGPWDGAIEFPGQSYPMSAIFHRNGTHWAGEFISEEGSVPFGKVQYQELKVTFEFPPEAGTVRWQGKLDPEKQTITGTFSQSSPNGSMSAPFSLKRLIDPSIHWGGETYVDDLRLVAGLDSDPGENLVQNGDFELPLTNTWTVSSNHAASTLSTQIRHSGQSSLHLIASRGGGSTDTALWQSISPLQPGQVYTLSYWYLPSTNGNDLTIRTDDGALVSEHSLAPDRAATPGAPNSTAWDAIPLPEVFLSEVQPINTHGPADQQGHREPWVELVNLSSKPIALAGLSLRPHLEASMGWSLPEDAILEPGQYRLVWLDGHPEETVPGEWHANWRLEGDTGSVALVQHLGQDDLVVDYLAYGPIQADESFGFLNPHNPAGSRGLLPNPTPGQINMPGPAFPVIVINEWMAENDNGLPNPDTGRSSDWLELFNPSATAIDLSGYSLTDNLTSAVRWIIPAGTTLNPQAYLVIWADGQPTLNGPGKSLHADFKLNQDGEAIALFSPDGRLVDAVVFTQQFPNVSQGRWPNGQTGNAAFFSYPTPGSENSLAPVHPRPLVIHNACLANERQLLIEWASQPGSTYQVQFQDTAGSEGWMNLGDCIRATGDTARLVDSILEPACQRFYRVIRKD